MLSQEEKETHSVKQCKACREKYSVLTEVFPTPRRRRKTPVAVPRGPNTATIQLSEQDLSTPKALGRKVLRELNNISQEKFQKSGEEVIVETPKSHLTHKPTSRDQRKRRLKIEKNMKEVIAQEKEEQASDLVLQNRISWKTYDKLRKAEGLTATPKRPAQSRAQGEPSQKKRYGNLSCTLSIDKEKLLQEARTWSPDKVINWSQLARDYGMEALNGGQMVKEYLKVHSIPAASIQQRPSRAQRRCKKKISACGKITLPMYPTVMHEKGKVQERISAEK